MSQDWSEKRTTRVLWLIVAACGVFILLYVLGVRPSPRDDEPEPVSDFEEDEYEDVLLQPQTVDDMKYTVEFGRNVAPLREDEKQAVDTDLIQPESRTGGLSTAPMEEISL